MRTSHDRRAAARRRAWGRGPIILRFEPLEGRQLLSTASVPLPDLVASSFATPHNLDWGDSFEAVGQVSNQGAVATQSPFEVDIYASTHPYLTSTSVFLGEATIAAGLQPGQAASFDQQISLPSTPIPGLKTQNVYVTLLVNPTKIVPESNYQNDQGVGMGYDTSAITITPAQPADLIGTSLGVSPDPVAWGGTVTVTAQIQNNAAGNAPATTARLVLTPLGQALGGAADVTIGTIAVPAIPAWQTVNLVQTITLPAQAPLALSGSTQYTLTMIQDAGYLTDPAYLPPAPQGPGLDQASLTINPGPDANAPTGPLPQLAAGSVLIPSGPHLWGQDVQVSTTVQNIGQGDAGSFQVAFLLVSANGSLNNALYLGGTTIAGLSAGATRNINQTLTIPNRVPAGMTLSSVSVSRIAVLIDPDNVINEPYQNNRTAESAPFVLRVLGADGTSTVPTSPAPRISGAVTTAGVTKAAPKPTLAQRTGKLQRTLRPPQQHTVAYNVEHTLSVFPSQAVSWFNDLIKKKK